MSRLLACPVAAATIEAAQPLLSRSELAHAAALAGTRRATWMLGRALLRQALADTSGSAPLAFDFTRSANGKLQLTDSTSPVAAPAFNLSHTAHWVVVAVGGTGPVGVDIDQAQRELDPLRIARRYFSAAEVRSLEGFDPAERGRQFMALWTLKEAYVKALGCGIAGGLARTAFALTAASARLTADAGWQGAVTAWQWRLPDPHGDSWLALIALDQLAAPRLQLAQPRAGGGFNALPWRTPQLCRTFYRPAIAPESPP